jgi:hypothetical protein
MQGAALFWKFCNWILNLDEDNILCYGSQGENGLANIPKLSHGNVLSMTTMMEDGQMDEPELHKFVDYLNSSSSSG